MKLTELQKKLIIELKNQEIQTDWIRWALWRLKTEKQQLEMMKYLETTRNKVENSNKFVLKTIEIKNTIKD